MLVMGFTPKGKWFGLVLGRILCGLGMNKCQPLIVHIFLYILVHKCLHFRIFYVHIAAEIGLSSASVLVFISNPPPCADGIYQSIYYSLSIIICVSMLTYPHIPIHILPQGVASTRPAYLYTSLSPSAHSEGNTKYMILSVYKLIYTSYVYRC